MKNWYKSAQDTTTTTTTQGYSFSNTPAPAAPAVPAAGMPTRVIQDPAQAAAFQQNIAQWKSDVRTNKIPAMIRDINTMFQGSLKGMPLTAIPNLISKEISARGYFTDPAGNPLDPNLATQLANLVSKSFIGSADDPNQIQPDDKSKTDLQTSLINSNDFSRVLNQIVQKEMPE